ncbi:WD40-repeat-containing domain protein [Aspergillus cavernicola]|uniref:WD40-repeat-containing domain protein n=1 Tax=Aspergillus cavernicola TaxID=176166 RepID=A0ABR4IQF5_9EURO
MAEALRADGPGSSVSRLSAVPAIVTSDPSGLITNDAHTSFHDESSPITPVRSGLLRSSQSILIEPAASDVASGSSGNPQDAKKPSRPGPVYGSGSGLAGRNSTSSPTVFESADSSAIDPLSQHIIKRTNTQKSIPLRLLGRASYEAEAGGSDKYSLVEQGPTRGDSALQKPKPPKEKKKGVSFLSRIIPGKKKEILFDEEDNASEMGNGRNDAHVAAQPIGFFPRFPPPPKYIRVRAHYKKEKTFNRLFQAQELESPDGPAPTAEDERPDTANSQSSKSGGKAIWALVFSNDGKYLAAAGQDKKVRVWSVIASPKDRDTSESEEDDDMLRLKAPVFKKKPIQVYDSHTGSILDLSWSKNNFLLSSSMDKTVRLWHISRPECLCCFKHSDFVTSIQFHPRDDRFFLAGSLDMKLRLWSIPDKSVAFTVTVPDMVTSVAFTPDGRYSMAGCLNGMLNIYETDGLKPAGSIHVRSARGRNAKGSKITGIDTMVSPQDDPNGDVKLLITSNDSRIRLYDFRERTLEAKFRGNENTCSQIRATFSDDGNHVICGSEDRRAYIWPMGPVEKDADKRSFEVLDTQSAMVTAAVMAPNKTKQVLGISEDPIYDLCNPPPVTLGSQPNKENGRQKRISTASGMAQESPGYLSRSIHPDGNIIIAADYSGKIKVFRQDCAHQKRRYDSWDTHSTISRRLLRRTNSARQSIASSIGKESSHKTPSERIISWRNSVIGHDNGNNSQNQQRNRTRSSSPQKAMRGASRNSSPGRGSSGARGESRSAFTTTPPQSAYKSSFESPRASFAEARKRNGAKAEGPRNAPALSSAAEVISKGNNKDNPMWLQGDQSYAFYNKITQDALAVQRNSPGLLNPNGGPDNTLERKLTSRSILSSEDATSNASGDENEVLRCDGCWGTNFKATKGRNGKQRLICVRCSRPLPSPFREQ